MAKVKKKNKEKLVTFYVIRKAQKREAQREEREGDHRPEEVRRSRAENKREEESCKNNERANVSVARQCKTRPFGER
jgi:hypothetical protein